MHLCFKFSRNQSSLRLVRNLSSAQLPHLPVPALQETLKKCLRTIQPLVTEEQLKQTDSIFNKFGEPGGLGAKLQDLLLKRAEKEENWLAEWWLNTAYLEFRSPVVVYSSPGLVMPQQQFESAEDQLHFAAQLILAVLDFKSLIDRVEIMIIHWTVWQLAEWWLNTAYLEFRSPVVVYSSTGLFMPQQQFESAEDQLHFAAQLILAVLDFKSLIDREQLKPEMMGKDPLDMAQYKKVFGTCRLPRIPRDELVYHSTSKHIIVMHRNNIFQLNVLAEDGSLYSESQLFSALGLITDLTEQEVTPVGVLTSDSRDNWSKTYQLLAQDAGNVEVLKSIESALFLVCLDQASDTTGLDDRTVSGRQTMHGDGAMSNGGNRWFDKTIQFLVSEEGRVGLTYEHSPAEGQPIASIVDHIMGYIDGNKFEQVVGDPTPAANLCIPLKFKISKEVQEAIKTAAANLQKLVNDVEACGFSFDKYGKEFIKSQKLSPDSYIQMAMQFAFYRLHKVPGAHYESAATRKFLHGRTETIRSCSVESVTFAKTMLDSSASPHEKLAALKKAINGHKDYTLQALNGLGVDRHLLGLKLTAISHGLPVPPLFSDHGYLQSLHMRLSTSQVAVKSDGFMIYGPLVEDGYGCCYNPRSNDIKFGTTAMNSCAETSAVKFVESLDQSLTDMHQLLISTPTAHL